MRRMLAALVAALVLTPQAYAAPPPPPPEHVTHARRALTAANIDAATLAPLFADDVTALENGKTVATGKTAWLKLLSSSLQNKSRRTILYSEGLADMLIVDSYDSVDRSDLRPGMIADPRMAARTTLYQFGADKKIQTVRISLTMGLWSAEPRN